MANAALPHLEGGHRSALDLGRLVGTAQHERSISQWFGLETGVLPVADIGPPCRLSDVVLASLRTSA